MRQPVSEMMSVPTIRTAELKMSIAGRSIEAKVEVPEGPARPRQLLPLLQSLTNAVVDIASDVVAEQGKQISCRAGCGACCRQLVPISQAEAYRLTELLGQFPEPRKNIIHERFAHAQQRLADAGMLDKLTEPSDLAEDTLHPLAMEYFRLGIACPFLEQESCSIHLDRPLACREYMVTSPAENCRQPTAATIERVEVPLKISGALARVERGSRQGLVPWVPLALVPQWVSQHPEPPPDRIGPDIMQAIVNEFGGRDTPPGALPR